MSRTSKDIFSGTYFKSSDGPVTLFRVYPDGTDAEQAYQHELHDSEYRKQTEIYTAYNRHLSELLHQQAMQGEGVLLSWTEAYQRASYDNGSKIAALKLFIMSPWTDIHAVR